MSMKNFASNQSLRSFLLRKKLFVVSVLGWITLSTASYAQDLKLPEDFAIEDEDFIELDDQKKQTQPKNPKPTPETAPQKREPRAELPPESDNGPEYDSSNRPSDQRAQAGNPSKTGNECQGARLGDYVHAYDKYTRIFQDRGRILITYPVFTISSDQMPMNNARRGFAPSPGYNVIEVVEQRPVFYPASQVPVLDVYGRPMFQIDPWGRQIPMMRFLPERVVMEAVKVQKMVPTQGNQTRDPELSQDQCVALSTLRVEEIRGARSTQQALEMIQRNPRALKRDAGQSTNEPTPKQLGPFATNDRIQNLR